MRRLHIFLFVLATTLAVLVTLALVSWYFAASNPSYYGSSWMGQMWGSYGGYSGGMGGMMGNGATSVSYLWVIPVALIVVVSAAIIGVGFYLIYPELKYVRGGSCVTQKTENSPSPSAPPAYSAPPTPVSPTAQSKPATSTNCEVLLKTMTPDEQKVMNVLVAHKGKYLQKYVGKEAGLSRLKTHRIVTRFVQRGIVTVKEFGNTNEIAVSDWVQNSN